MKIVKTQNGFVIPAWKRGKHEEDLEELEF